MDSIKHGRRQSRFNRQRAQSLMEFALTLPIILFVTMAIFDFGRALFTYAEASNRLRTALRYGAILGYATDSPNYARCQDMIDIARRITFDSGTSSIEVTYRNGNTAATEPLTYDNDSNTVTPQVAMTCTSTGTTVPVNAIIAGTANGDLIHITVNAQVRTITPIFPENLPIILQGQRTLVKEVILKSCGDGDFDPSSENCRNCLDDWEAVFGPLSSSIESPACIAGPLNFTGTSPTPAPVVLTWTQVADVQADYLQIQRRTVGGIWGTITTPPLHLDDDVTTFSDSGVNSGTTYEYRIRYYRDVPVPEYSDWSEVTIVVGSSSPSGVPVGDPGSEPGSFAGVGGPTAQVVLSWTDTTNNENGFQFERATAAGGPWGNAFTAPAGSTGTTDTNVNGVSCGGVYWYRIRSYETQGQDSESAWVTIGPITVNCGTVPAVPTVALTVVSDTAITVSWSPHPACTPACTFEIERSLTGTWPGTALPLTPSTAQSHPDTGLTCSTQYYYRVRASSGGLYSAWSATASATTQNGSCGVRPASPTALFLSGRTSVQASAPDNKYILVQWVDNANNETAYNIYRANWVSGACGPYSLLSTFTGTNNPPQAAQSFTSGTGTTVMYHDYTAVLGQRHCYQVYAYIISTGMQSTLSLTGNAATYAVPTIALNACGSQGQDGWHNIVWTNNAGSAPSQWTLWADRTGSGFSAIDFKLIFTTAATSCGSRRPSDLTHCFNGNQSFWLQSLPYQFYVIGGWGNDTATSAIVPSGGAGMICN